jgi:molybdate transport system substrate-binding protein
MAPAINKGTREDSMTMRFLMLAATAAALALSAPAKASEIKVLSSNALKTVLEDLGPKFEKATENKLAITFGTAASLKVAIEKGAAVDVAILTDAGVDDLIKQGKLASRVALARSGAGVAIKKGAPKPDISTTDAFKKTLLAAKSIAYVEQGATGIYLKGLFEKLGVADQIKAKTKFVKSAGEAVANGEAEIGFTQISEILPYAGAEVAGPLPAEIQLYTNWTLGIGGKDAKAAEAFAKFMTTPASAAVLKAKGLEPR